ncbi:outer membrane protein assembly factor BamE [Roseibacillus persicicus]|uniref:SecDF P1 head subdomain-containing protein n=1 Tax=Roseibacillus persicicus TaxID=454148 RepID=UPI00398B3C9F
MADAPGNGIERMVLKTEDGEEVLFVKTKSVLGDADVKRAQADLAFGHQINVWLNDAGRKKLKETTAAMRHGRDRLAIIMDGRLICAPVVQSTLGSQFVVSGFQDMEFRELDDLARKMSGRPPRPEGEEPLPPEPPPKIETVPFTEEEYQANKAMREKVGIFHIDSVPTEEDLNKVLRKGMARDEVLKLFGKPYMASDKPHDNDFYFIYTVAPEKRPENPKRKALPDGFKVDFGKGKVSWWSHTYSAAAREKKVVGRQEPTLKAILPEVDFSAGDLDLVAYVEGIVVPDPKQSVNSRDLGDLISIAIMISGTLDEDAKKTTLDANCDYMKTLSHNFPDIAELRKSAKEGRVEIEKLSDTLSPYAYGEKKLPGQTKRVKQDGADQPATALESKSKGDSKPQPESEGRSQ